MRITDATRFCIWLGCNNNAAPDTLLCPQHAALKAKEKPNGFAEFMDGVRALVESKAAEKGYNDGGTEGNDLMEFTNKFFPGHAAGEVCYKMIRYARKKQKEDLLKAAAWAYLLWMYDN